MRFLKRMLIWWRWPMAVVAALLLAAILPSGWFALWFKIPVVPDTSAMIISGNVWIAHKAGVGFRRRVDLIDHASEYGRSWNFWDFQLQLDDPGFQEFGAPLWAVALPPLTLAAAGFWLRRRQCGLGECAGCRHPLMGAARCPECGRASTDSAARDPTRPTHSPVRVRFMTRTIIWWRWPMAVVASLLLAAILPSGWYEMWFRPPMLTRVSMGVRCGQIRVLYAADSRHPSLPSNGLHDLKEGPSWDSFDFEISVFQPFFKYIWAPLWTAALPPLSVAIIGFWLRRRQPKPGECTECRHPLLGVAVCPKCGRAASAR